MNTLAQRLYAHYLMPSRLAQYARLVGHAKDLGYAQSSVRDFAGMPPHNDAVARVLVHRHDIDTDLRTARKMFAIEQSHGAQASYYFRLSTLDAGFMRDIEAYGSEASYHFEEIADFAKQHHIRDAAGVRNRLADIRQRFLGNVARIEDMLGMKLQTVASHGDFANRRLGVINREILDDNALREHCGFVCETYDPGLLERFDIYISDRPHPHYYHPQSPFEALGRHRRICLLTHPVQWETNWGENTRHNVRRLIEEWRW